MAEGSENINSRSHQMNAFTTQTVKKQHLLDPLVVAVPIDVTVQIDEDGKDSGYLSRGELASNLESAEESRGKNVSDRQPIEHQNLDELLNEDNTQLLPGHQLQDAHLQAKLANKQEVKRRITLATKVEEPPRPGIDDIASIFRVCKDPTDPPDDDQETYALCRLCCAPCNFAPNGSCKVGFGCTKQQCSAVHKGMKGVIDFWSDGITPPWKLACVLIKVFIYICLLSFTAAKFVYDSAQEKSVLPFNATIFCLTAIGQIVALIHALVFACIHLRDLKLCCKRLCHPICDRCRRRQMGFGQNEVVENQHGWDEAEIYVKNMELQLCMRKGKCAPCKVVLWNFTEVLLTIINDVIGTVVFILSLYSFLGGQHFALFYGDLHQSRWVSFGRLVFSSILLLFATHFLRLLTVGRNICRLSKKIEGNVEGLDLALPNTLSSVMFSFQWRLVAHIVLSSIFQLYAIFAMSWKIIQDTCSLASPSIPSTSGNGTALPFMCDIPHVVNGYTIYNILYVAFAPTVLGYLTYFVCNAPSLLEYMQLIAISSYQQMEKLGKGKYAAIEGNSPMIDLVKVFCSDLNCNVDFNYVEERARRGIQQILPQFTTDAPLGGRCYFVTAILQLFHSVLFVPACLIGALHLSLFLIHIFFMTCTVKGCFGINSLSIYSFSDSAHELSAVLIPLVILFLLTSFPGPWIGIFWFSVILLVTAVIGVVSGVVLSLVAAVTAIVLASIAVIVGVFIALVLALIGALCVAVASMVLALVIMVAFYILGFLCMLRDT